MREARLKYWHGEGWTDEDQKEFEKERNDRHTNNWRNRHRDKYNSYMKETQDRWRAEHPFYYGWKQQNRNHPENKMTYEQYYVAYRQNKERMKTKENE